MNVSEHSTISPFGIKHVKIALGALLLFQEKKCFLTNA